jgi:hypothetical protein
LVHEPLAVAVGIAPVTVLATPVTPMTTSALGYGQEPPVSTLHAAPDWAGAGLRTRGPPERPRTAGRVHGVAAEDGTGLVEGANGALRDPATGRFATNPDRVAPEPSSGLHGNSRLSDAPTSLYRLEDLNGTYLKTGITSNPAGRYTQEFMSDKFMNIINVGSRSNMMDLERFIVEFDPGPLNFEPWAGAAQ